MPATVASVANLGGLSLGPLVAGALLHWVGHPFTTSYLVFIALMVIGAVSVSLSPETVDLALPRSAGAPKFVLRHAQSTVFVGAAAVAFCSFAIFGLFSSVGSLIVHSELHESSPFIWGLAGFVVLGVSALAQTLFPKLAVVRMLILGLIGVPVGMALVVLALYNPSLTLYLLGSGIAGAGAGLLFKAALNVAITTAEPGSTAGVLALFFVVAYVGVGLPPVLLTAATHLISSRSALIVFSAVILGGVRRSLRGSKRQRCASDDPAQSTVRSTNDGIDRRAVHTSAGHRRADARLQARVVPDPPGRRARERRGLQADRHGPRLW